MNEESNDSTRLRKQMTQNTENKRIGNNHQALVALLT